MGLGGDLGDRYPQFSTRDSTYSIYARLKVKYEEQIHCSDKHIRSIGKILEGDGGTFLSEILTWLIMGA